MKRPDDSGKEVDSHARMFYREMTDADHEANGHDDTVPQLQILMDIADWLEGDDAPERIQSISFTLVRLEGEPDIEEAVVHYDPDVAFYQTREMVDALELEANRGSE